VERVDIRLPEVHEQTQVKRDREREIKKRRGGREVMDLIGASEDDR
jgi:hypothetical protein